MILNFPGLCRVAGLMLAAMLAATPVLAQTAASDDEAPILTISGNVQDDDGDGVITYTRDMIAAMEPVSFTTHTMWTEGPIEFKGISLAGLIRDLGIEKGTLKATAINDYAIEIPVSDALRQPAIIAYEMNGQPLSRRDKGPLWIVYPTDDHKEYLAEVYSSRSIWQLNKIVVE